MRRLVLCLVAAALVVAGCGGGAESTGEGKVVKVTYLEFGGGDPTDAWMKRVAKQFENANPEVDVQLQPITGSINDYYTRLALMQRSSSTAPDVLLEDSSNINADVKAGYLMPLDSYLADWPGWDQFVDAAKTATRAYDGKTYGVLMASDTRALWYNREILAEAGLPVPWQPKTWDDILAAARTIKQQVPDVAPFNIYASKAAGEGTSMQGFEMLLYGTEDPLYDEASGKWIAPSQGFEDALRFYDTVYSEKLGVSPQQMLNPQLPNMVTEKLLPEGKLAIALDGSWLPRAWVDGGSAAWPQWSEVLGIAAMPTQNGQPPGYTSMSGGFSLAISSKANNPDGGWKFIQLALNKENTQWVNIKGSLTTVREDVAESAAYTGSNPSVEPLTDLLEFTHFRPTLPAYPKVSAEIQKAVEAVATGQASPAAAMKRYEKAVTGIVGAEGVTGGAAG